MKAIVVLLISVLSLRGFRTAPGGSTLADSLAGSRWVSKVGEGCVDTLLFRTGGRIREYSCEVDEWYIGNFTVRGDTVIVTHFTQSEDGGGKERWRVRYLHCHDDIDQGDIHHPQEVLKAISHQGYWNGHWEKEESFQAPAYVFKRII